MRHAPRKIHVESCSKTIAPHGDTICDGPGSRPDSRRVASAVARSRGAWPWNRASLPTVYCRIQTVQRNGGRISAVSPVQHPLHPREPPPITPPPKHKDKRGTTDTTGQSPWPCARALPGATVPARVSNPAHACPRPPPSHTCAALRLPTVPLRAGAPALSHCARPSTQVDKARPRSVHASVRGTLRRPYPC